MNHLTPSNGNKPAGKSILFFCNEYRTFSGLGNNLLFGYGTQRSNPINFNVHSSCVSHATGTWSKKK